MRGSSAIPFCPIDIDGVRVDSLLFPLLKEANDVLLNILGLLANGPTKFPLVWGCGEAGGEGVNGKGLVKSRSAREYWWVLKYV